MWGGFYDGMLFSMTSPLSSTESDSSYYLGTSSTFQAAEIPYFQRPRGDSFLVFLKEWIDRNGICYFDRSLFWWKRRNSGDKKHSRDSSIRKNMMFLVRYHCSKTFKTYIRTYYLKRDIEEKFGNWNILWLIFVSFTRI